MRLARRSIRNWTTAFGQFAIVSRSRFPTVRSTATAPPGCRMLGREDSSSLASTSDVLSPMRILPHRLGLLSAPLLCVANLVAQAAPVPLHSEPVHLDSGYHDNLGKNPVVVATRELQVPGVAWLRVFFQQTHLPSGSRLRLTSLKDGLTQRHDANSLADYAGSSAYFNGDRIKIELVAGPGTRANRFLVTSTEYHRAPQGPLESICGPTDDRQRFTDARIARAVTGAGACTWWIIDEFTILTAGHCVTSAQNPVIVGFNIPLSTSTGTYVQPPPDDQYPVRLNSLRFGTGFGSDWAVAATERNSNHGEYAGQRQGAWFDLGPVPASPNGVTIRITGNGRVSAPVSPTWNAVTKTHTGPCVRTSSYVQYQTDTTGGNSGSPIIDEATGRSIGIHTHGGCSSTRGQNSGTRIDLAALRSAITVVQGSRTVGSMRGFGAGCGAPRPVMTMSGIPDIGQSVTVEVGGLPSGQPGFLLVGATDQAWNGAALPLALDFLGFVGCQLFVSVDATFALGTGTGSVSQTFPIPNQSAWIGARGFFQYMAAAPAGGAVFSNAFEMTVGN